MPSAGDAVRSAPKHGGRYPVRLLWCHRVNDGRLDDGWIIVTDAGAVETRRYGPFAQRGFRRRLERFGAERPVKPCVEIFFFQQHRHAVVIGLHPGAGARDDDRAGEDFFARRGIAPAVP
jgi:hypothetical protein